LAALLIGVYPNNFAIAENPGVADNLEDKRNRASAKLGNRTANLEPLVETQGVAIVDGCANNVKVGPVWVGRAWLDDATCSQQLGDRRSK